jgi:hypothetical protein
MTNRLTRDYARRIAPRSQQDGQQQSPRPLHGLAIGAALILGFVVYSSSEYGIHDAAPTPATTTQ